MLEHMRCDSIMEIWGDGEIVRDFLYIEDMVNAIRLLMNLSTDNEIYNVGTGMGYSLNQLKQIIERVCGNRLRVTCRPQRQVDVKEVALDCSRPKTRLGWQPKVSLEKGIRLTWQWLQNQ
jgi:UDP-glucose 4-epimerase